MADTSNSLSEIQQSTWLMNKLAATKFGTTMKALVFTGGPSSTRWVFIRSFEVFSACLVIVVAGAMWVYVRDAQHPIGTITPLIITLGTALVGFSSNSQNIKHQLGAQLQTSKPLDATSTPVSGEVNVDGEK